MNGDSRIERLMPRLSFDERLDGLLAAYQEDRQPDPALLRTMPDSDNARWNNVARILNGLHGSLGWYIDLVEAFVTQLELRLVLAGQAQFLAGVFRHNAPEMAAAAEQLSLRVISELLGRWQEVRLAELAVEHFSEELGGRSLLHPDVAATLKGCRERILAMQESLATADAPVRYEFALLEPQGADIERLLDLLLSQKVLA